jgi:hypothetical protein
MATTAGFSLTNDIMGKMNKNFFIYNLYFYKEWKFGWNVH